MNTVYIKKIKKSEIQNSSKIAWSTLKEIFNKNHIDVNQYELCYNAYGKPSYKDLPLYFNISHSKRYIAIAISTYEIGVDIQIIQSNPKIIKLNKYFNLPHPTPFLILSAFSKHEAYTKKIGTGIILSQLKKPMHHVYQTIIDGQYFLSIYTKHPFNIVHI